MNRKFLLNKLKKSKALVFDADLKEADSLENQGFYTSAFLRRWQVVESVNRELMIQYKACDEVDSLSLKVFNKLKKQKIDLETNNLKSQVCDVIYSDAKKRSETSARSIDVGVVERVFKCFESNYDTPKIRYLLASKLNRSDTLPDGITSRKTIRDQRNDIIHKNQSMSEEQYKKIMPCFNYFFDLVDQIGEENS